MKRFVETNNWRDPWFRKLSPQAKHLHRYLWDNCDCAGVITVDLDAITFHVGQRIEEKHLTELESWLQTIPGGKHLIPMFVDFQCGNLRESCPAHKPVMKAVLAHGLIKLGILYHHPVDSLSDSLSNRLLDREQEKEKEKEPEKEGGMQGGNPTLEAVKLAVEKTGLPESDAIWFWNKCEGNGWTNGGKKIRSWAHTIASWKAAGYMPSQKQCKIRSDLPFDGMTDAEILREAIG